MPGIDIADQLTLRAQDPAPASAGARMGLQGDRYGSVVNSPMLPERALLCAGGNAYVVEDSSARAALAAVPTTAALLGLWNGEAAGGKSYVIDGIGCTFAAQTANAAWAARVYANIGKLDLTAPSSLVSPFCLNGGNYAGSGRPFATPTTVAADGWFGIGNAATCPGGVTINPGHGIYIPINGNIIIQPKKFLALHLVATATAVTGFLSIWWHEVQV